MYEAKSIAEYIIYLCKKKGYLVNNMKLQKLLYFTQATFLVALNQKCFEEDIEAWDVGPVIPDVYYEYAKYGGCSCDCKTTNFSYITENDKKFIQTVVNDCGPLTSSYLTNITLHQKPWMIAYATSKKNRIISCKELKEFFE